MVNWRPKDEPGPNQDDHIFGEPDDRTSAEPAPNRKHCEPSHFSAVSEKLVRWFGSLFWFANQGLFVGWFGSGGGMKCPTPNQHSKPTRSKPGPTKA
jgi:hypothetical protein